MVSGVAARPLRCSAACPGLRRGKVLVGGRWGHGSAVTGSGGSGRGGGRAAGGFEQVHPSGLVVPSGRCMVMWPRPWQAMRAATAISWLRMVVPRAFAQEASARQPAARVRLWQSRSASRRWDRMTSGSGDFAATTSRPSGVTGPTLFGPRRRSVIAATEQTKAPCCLSWLFRIAEWLTGDSSDPVYLSAGVA